MPNLVQLIQVFGPVKEILVGLAITGSLIYSIPISNETKAKSSMRPLLLCLRDITHSLHCRVLEPRRTRPRLALITFIMHSLNWANKPSCLLLVVAAGRCFEYLFVILLEIVKHCLSERSR